MYFIIILLATIIGTWYAAAWLKNGWWLWLIVPALPFVTILAIAFVGLIPRPDLSFGTMLVVDAYGVLFGPILGWVIALPIAFWTRWRRRSQQAREA